MVEDRWTMMLQDSRDRARDQGFALHEPAPPVVPEGISLPVKIHFVSSCQLMGNLFDYGDERTITEQMLPALGDKDGRVAVLEMLHDPDAQRRHWGSWRIRPGEWPAGTSKFAPGSARWDAARSDYYRYARGLAFESERESALVEARKGFGPNEFGPCPAGIIARAYGFEPQQ